MIEATKSLDADARWLKAHGVEGSFDELRAKAFAALLAHKPLNSLIPGRADGTVADPSPPAPHRPADPVPPARRRRRARPGPPGPAGPAPAGATAPWPGDTGPRLGGTVHLTMPATAWLGLSEPR